MNKPPWNCRSYRRLLIDMQIPDWEPEFLSRYDPQACLQAALDAGAEAVMLYFQSHTGLTNWPTETGRQHAAFSGRDVMAETLDVAAKLGLPTCAYYSVNFNNEAWQNHPEWRFVPAAPAMIGGGVLVRERYGVCCLNNPDYVRFVQTQVAELLNRFAVDALFYDMIWWMGVCLCGNCQQRYRFATGNEIPGQIDWYDSEWCRFQATRERWLTEFAFELRDLAKKLRPGVCVYQNFALGMMDWTRGVSFRSAAAHDFLGGDFYAGRDEQVLVSQLMNNLSKSRPIEFMTTVTTNLSQHETLKPTEQLRQETLAAAASGSASLLIASLDPDGSLHQGQMDHIANAFSARAAYDQELGGNAIEQIAVYFSDDSKMTFQENGQPLNTPRDRSPVDYPHFHAVAGACRKLQQAHLTFGVISRRQLDELNSYDVVVLPDVLRMSIGEAEAFRDYVSNGGRLYASRYTSLTGSDGVQHDDFQLADLFGCHFDQVETGRMVHLASNDELFRDAIYPQRMLSHDIAADDNSGIIRVSSNSQESRILATVNLPYGHPSAGSIEGRDWSSIHSSPPWQSTDMPAIVSKQLGDGRVTYSAANIEAGASAAHDRLFVRLVRDLLPRCPLVEADAHPTIWITAYDQPDRRRILINLLSVSAELPVLTSAAVVRLMPPPNKRCVSVTLLPGGSSLEFSESCNGIVHIELSLSTQLTMVAANFESIQ